VLAARIDRLPSEEKRLFQTAAIIGTEVPLALLQAIAEVPEDAVHRGLAYLQAAEFLYETRLFPEHVYTFKHALTHEVAYGSLLQEQRRVLHGRTVEAIERLAPDQVAEQVERLAHHALRGEVWDRAVTYYQQAGARALSRPAYREAVACFEQALVALQHLPEDHSTMAQGIDLRLDLQAALHVLGEYGRLLDYVREAERLATVLDDQRRLGQVSMGIASYLWWTGDPERALVAGHRALAIATALEDVALEGRLPHFLGVIYRVSGDYRQSIEYVSRSLAACEGDRLYQQSGFALLSVQCHAVLSMTHAECGTFAEGREHGEQGRRIAEAVDHLYSRCLMCSAVGHLHLLQGDLNQAIPILETGLGLCQSGNILRLFPDLAARLGAAYTLAERVAEALPLLEQAVAQAAAMQHLTLQALRVAWLSEAYLLAGQSEEAAQLAQCALELARTHQERGHEAWALRLLGNMAAHYDPPTVDQAEQYYRQALALAEELGMRPLLAHCHRGLGTLYARTGQREQARAELTAATDLYRAMEMSFWLLQAEAALAQMEGQP